MPGNFESLNSLDFLRGYADGDQVNGEQDRFKETSDIVTDMAENRIEGITQDEARSLGETIRDFFSNKGSMDEFRKKNAAKIEADKKLIMITDLLGRPVKENKNKLLFYIYNNGTVEKKLIKQ